MPKNPKNAQELLMQQCSCLPFRLSAVAGLVSFLHLRISTRKFSKSSHHQLSIGAWMYNDVNEEPNTSSTEPRVPGSKRLFQGPAAHRMWMFCFARLAIHCTIRQSWRSISLFSVRLCREWAPNRMGNWATDDRLEKLMRTSVARQNVLGKLRWALMLLWPVNFAVLTKLDTAVGSLSWATYFSRHHCSTVARLRRKGGSVKGRGDSTNRSFKN